MKNIFKALVISGLLLAGVTTQASAQHYEHPHYYGYYHPHYGYYDHPHYGWDRPHYRYWDRPHYDHPRYCGYRGY